METSKFHFEKRRIQSIYKERDKNDSYKRGIKSNLSNYNLLMYSKKILYQLKKNKINIYNSKILDFGCGNGGRLIEWLRLGAELKNLYGIDLNKKRVKYAQQLFKKTNIKYCSCESTNFPSDFFDITLNATMMSSVNNELLSKKIAKEMIRVTKKGGYIIWLDLKFRNPFNTNVRGYSKKEIKELFKGCKFIFKTSTIVPLKIFENLPLIALSLIELLNIFNLHNLVFIKKT